VAMADRRRNSGMQRQSSGEEMAFYRGEFVVEKGSRRSSGGSRHGHGMATRAWRRAAASNQWCKAALPSDGWGSAAWHRPGHSRASRTGAKVRRTDRWS
jgi:hypothetical protein